MKAVKHMLTNFWKDEEGLGTLEILLIIAVLIAVALLFKDKIIEWVERILNKSDTELNKF